MIKYKELFPDAENSIVHQKASYYHSYGVWIKTVDVIDVLSQAAQILYSKNDEGTVASSNISGGCAMRSIR